MVWWLCTYHFTCNVSSFECVFVRICWSFGGLCLSPYVKNNVLVDFKIFKYHK